MEPNYITFENYLLKEKQDIQKVYKIFFQKQDSFVENSETFCFHYLKEQHDIITKSLKDYIIHKLNGANVQYNDEIIETIDKKILRFKFQNGVTLVYIYYQVDENQEPNERLIDFRIEFSDYPKLVNRLKALKKDIYKGIATLKAVIRKK